MAQIIRRDFSKKQGTNDAKEPIPCYQLTITVTFSDPPIWRTIQVPGELTLAGLHRVIQHCMAWSDSHAHQFLVGKIFYKQAPRNPADAAAEDRYETDVQLHQLEKYMGFIFTYLYDSGDGWECEITLDKTLKPGKVIRPTLLDGERAAPPENMPDIHTYQALLNSMTDKGQQQALAASELPDNFAPDTFDRKRIDNRLKTSI